MENVRDISVKVLIFTYLHNILNSQSLNQCTLIFFLFLNNNHELNNLTLKKEIKTRNTILKNK
jgi:hypothetical protein